MVNQPALKDLLGTCLKYAVAYAQPFLLVVGLYHAQLSTDQPSSNGESSVAKHQAAPAGPL